MSAAATAPDPVPQPARWPASTDRRGCLARLLGLVRRLIDHGRQLAAAVGQRSLTDDPVLANCRFGTLDIALIMSRITLALHRATALEARLLRSAARPDPKPQPPRVSPPRPPRPPGWLVGGASGSGAGGTLPPSLNAQRLSPLGDNWNELPAESTATYCSPFTS